MRREQLFLQDIVVAADKIEVIAGSTTQEMFLADELMTAAVLFHFTVVGEAVSRLSKDLRGRYPDVLWVDIVATRHRIVHGYFSLDWDILWDAAVNDVPVLRGRVLEILNLEYPGWKTDGI